jgi:hypothetical protein
MDKNKKELILKIILETAVLIFAIAITIEIGYKEKDYKLLEKGIGVVIVYISLVFMNMQKYNKVKKAILMKEYSESKYCEIFKEHITEEKCFKMTESLEFFEKHKIISHFRIKNKENVKKLSEICKNCDYRK